MPIEIQTPKASRRASASPGAPERSSSSSGSSAWTLGRPGVSARDRMFLTERLSLLLETGIPLHGSLVSLASQSGSPSLQNVLRELASDVESGLSFSQALGRHGDVFPRTYVNLIAAAEQGGFLPAALERLRAMEERRQDLQSSLRAAISYPAFLAVFSSAVVVFVLVVVFPKFDDLFTLIHDQLPITTRWLMATSELIRRWWLPGLLVLGGGGAAMASWLRRSEGAEFFDRIAMGTPLVRDIVIQLNMVQLLRVMSLSLGNGVSMVDSIRSARETVPSPTFKRFADHLERRVLEGQGLASGFASEERVPDLVKQMVGTGDEAGSLASVMERLADFYEREWRRALEMISKIAEPAMLLLMGCVVGLIVSSLILPIFKLSRAVH